jgi:GNAT superfamily N-acetyltransferase
MNTPEDQPLPRRRSQQHQVVTADAADTDALSQVIANAFHDLPQSEWLISDPDARRQILPGYFRLLIEHAMANSTVHTTADHAAAALWIPVGREGSSQPADYAARLTAVTGQWAERFKTFDTVLDRHHPSGVAYHHLAILAVHPDRQGEGIGSALLRAYNQVLDREPDALTYLEAAGLRSRQLYRRHGYLPSGLFYLPGDGPAMWPMVRPPRSRSRLPGQDATGPISATAQRVDVPRPRSAPETTP